MLFRLDESTKNFVMALSLPKDLDAIYSPVSRHLNFGELQKALTDLGELIEEFKALANYVTKEYEIEKTGL